MIKKLLLVSRPISWVNTAYPFAAAYLLAQQKVDAVLIVGTLFFLIPYNLLMYGINDVFDYESDIRNPRKGGLEGAIAAKKTHRTIIWASIVSTVPFVVYLMCNESLVSSLILLLVLFFVIAYSAPKLRFKERPFVDSMTSSAHFCGPLVYALSFSHFPGNSWLFIMAFFLWGMASHAFGAVQDILPDRAAHIASIATAFGAKWTVRFAAVLYVLSSAILATAGPYAALAGIVNLSYAANILPYVSITDATSARSNTAWRRFLSLNYFTGFLVTVIIILYAKYS